MRMWCRGRPVPTYALARTRHDGALWEVAGEEVIVHGDVFVAHGILLKLALDHAVDQEEREPAWRCPYCQMAIDAFAHVL